MSNTRFLSLILLAASIISSPLQAQQIILFNGGIGADERAQAPAQGTRLVFFVQSGSFISGVKVQVRDSKGDTVVDTLTKGPWLILDLPPGQYQVRAEARDNAQGGIINVTNEAAEFAFMFPGND